MNEQIKQMIAEALNVEPAELTSDKRLQDFEYWDSIMVLSVMVIISDAVGKEILPEEVVGLRTFGDIEALVASKAA